MPRSFFGAPPPAAFQFQDTGPTNAGTAPQSLLHTTVGAGCTLAATAVDRMFGDAAAAGAGGGGGLQRLLGGDDRQLSIAFTIDQIISNGEDLGLVLADEMLDAPPAGLAAAAARAGNGIGVDLTSAEAAAAFAAAACSDTPPPDAAAARDVSSRPKDQGAWPQQADCGDQQQELHQPQRHVVAPGNAAGIVQFNPAEDPDAWLDGVPSDDDLLLDDQGGQIALAFERDSANAYSNIRGHDLTYSSCASLTAAMQGLNPSISGPHVGTMQLGRGGFGASGSANVHSGTFMQQQQQHVLQQQNSTNYRSESPSVMPGPAGLQQHSPPLAAASPGDSSNGVRGPALSGADRSYHSRLQPHADGMEQMARNPWVQQAGAAADVPLGGPLGHHDLGDLQQLIMTQDMEEDGGLVSTMELPGVMRNAAAPPDPQQRLHAGAMGAAAPKQHQGTPPSSSFADRLQGLISKTAALLGGDKSSRGGAAAVAVPPTPQASALQVERSPNSLLGTTMSAPVSLMGPAGLPIPGGGFATGPASSTSNSAAAHASADDAISGGHNAAVPLQQTQSAPHGLFRRRPQVERPRTMVFSRERMISSALERQAQHRLAEMQHQASTKSRAGGGQARGAARRRASAVSYTEAESSAAAAAARAAAAGPNSDTLPVLRECFSGGSFPGGLADDATGSFNAGLPPAGRRAFSSSTAASSSGRHSFTGEKRPVSDCVGVHEGDSSKRLHSAFLDFVSQGAVLGGGSLGAVASSDLFGGDASAAAAFQAAHGMHTGGWASGPAVFGGADNGDGGVSMSCPLLLLSSGASGSGGVAIPPSLSGALPSIPEGIIGLCPAPEAPQLLRPHSAHPHHVLTAQHSHGHRHMQQQHAMAGSGAAGHPLFYAAGASGDDMTASGEFVWSAPTAPTSASAPLWQSGASCITNVGAITDTGHLQVGWGSASPAPFGAGL